MRYPLAEVIQELEAELAIRRKAYPRWVEMGRLKPEQASRKVALLEQAISQLRALEEVRGEADRLDALLAQRVRDADAQGKARIITSREIQDATGIPPRRLGEMMTQRGWQRVWVAHGVRGWLLPMDADPFRADERKGAVSEAGGEEEAINSMADTVDNSIVNTVESEGQCINSNADTVGNTNSDSVEAPRSECDHRLLALADLTQMDEFTFVSLARQMLERVKGMRLCGRCALVAGAIQVTQMETASRARQRILRVVERARLQPPAVQAAGEMDPLEFIEEEYRALAQFVLQHLASHKVETFMRLCEALQRHLPREKRRDAAFLLSRLAEQYGFQQLVKVERKGDHLMQSVWSLRSEPSLFSAT